MYNIDKLFQAVAERGHVCVGLDTAAEYIPQKELARHSPHSPAEAVLAYNKAIIDATLDIAACYKVQIAYYEELGIAGLESYAATLKHLRDKGALVIADIKRGDIADTASRYARAHFEGDFEADFVTLNPYMGMDSIQPWLQWADKKGKGAFVLMRTSNKGRWDFEELELKETPGQHTERTGHTAGRRLYDVVGDKLSQLAASHLGKHGYGAFGAVVGADPQSQAEREEAAAIRARRPNLFFLIPGYGAQGGAAADAALLLREGNGGVVNASRSILKAWQSKAAADGVNPAATDNAFAANAARQAAVEMRDAIRKAVQ
ncbi:MAG: orotidine-5'-phosphate decarboxylase [Treponema sp.]|nr:orotidine-5'-phosphate decarboxylase [Treponema sp.]